MSLADDIKRGLDEIWPFAAEPIIYKTFTGQIATGDPVIGTPDTHNYTSIEEMALSEEIDVQEIAVSGGRYVFGDMEFTIRRATKPAYEDRIVYGGATWKPVDVKHLWLSEFIYWVVRAGKE